MKKISKYIAFTGLMLIFFNCENELDLTPLGQLDENTFYQTESDFAAASLSPYSTLLNYTWDQFGGGWYNSVLMPDDDAVPRNNVGDDNDDFNWQSNNGDFRRVWEESYKGIMRANTIIEQLPNAAQFTDEAKKRYFGQKIYFKF